MPGAAEKSVAPEGMAQDHDPGRPRDVVRGLERAAEERRHARPRRRSSRSPSGPRAAWARRAPSAAVPGSCSAFPRARRTPGSARGSRGRPDRTSRRRAGSACGRSARKARGVRAPRTAADAGSTASATLQSAVAPPRPSPRVRTARAVKPGRRARRRAAWATSCHAPVIRVPLPARVQHLECSNARSRDSSPQKVARLRHRGVQGTRSGKGPNRTSFVAANRRRQRG